MTKWTTTTMPNTVLSDSVDLYSEVPNRGNPRIMKYSLRIKILFSTRINMFVIENNDEIADILMKIQTKSKGNLKECLQDCQKSTNRSSKMSLQPISQWKIKNWTFWGLLIALWGTKKCGWYLWKYHCWHAEAGLAKEPYNPFWGRDGLS